MQAEHEEAMSAYAEAERDLQAGRLADARNSARSALATHGPDARLSLILGRAHMAEDDDDHDDRAEAAYREGLDSFPDDLDLLTAYAELCLASDYLERPSRHRRGPELALRVRELAPGSQQALRLEQRARRGGSLGIKGPRPPSPQRTQLYDARLALSTAGDPRSAAVRAGAQALAHPGDDRLAVLTETLTALTRPGRAPLRWTVRAPLTTALLRGAWCVAVLLAVPALHLPGWARLAVLVPSLPALALRGSLLRRARARAAARPPAPPEDTSGAPASPSLPPVPAYRRRELATGGAILVCLVAASTISGIWSYRQYTAYPHYTVAAPEHVRGFARQHGGSTLERLEGAMDPDVPGGNWHPYVYTYGADPEHPAIAVWGATGDFHDAPSNAVRDLQESIDEPGFTPRSNWNADPGRLGGTMRCMAYEAQGVPMLNCVWLDKGSMGTVCFGDEGQDHEATAALARSVREAVMHRDATAGAEA
ncbi:hypothetical protein [Streptomyces hundungensis]|uniref:hypothetical protein n=1 Tax=Streptomyces hundungensis TaxID=1077946 RepID=UPI0033C6CB9D